MDGRSAEEERGAVAGPPEDDRVAVAVPSTPNGGVGGVAVAGGLTDSDFQEGSYDDDADEESSEGGEDEDGDDTEINDAGLLRSMLKDSEEYYASLAAQEAREEKHCWVCFASEEDDPAAAWSHPCRCRGTTKWVHQACIQRWVDEKQKGNTTAEVQCPQCNTTYVIKFPKANLLVAVLDTTDKMIQRICPIVAGAVCVGSLYWTCVTFGAVTVMQLLGERQGLVLIELADPLFLLVSLPLVPVGLVLGKMIRWEEPVLKFLRTAVPRIPLSRFVLPSFAISPEQRAAAAAVRNARLTGGVSAEQQQQAAAAAAAAANAAAALPPVSDAVSVTRTFCGALFLPSIAAFLGSALYGGTSSSRFRRTLLGGLTFVVVKGALKIYHRQHTYIRQCQRVIVDYNELPSAAAATSNSANRRRSN